jgi:hypothetical protein
MDRAAQTRGVESLRSISSYAESRHASNGRWAKHVTSERIRAGREQRTLSQLVRILLRKCCLRRSTLYPVMLPMDIRRKSVRQSGEPADIDDDKSGICHGDTLRRHVTNQHEGRSPSRR